MKKVKELAQKVKDWVKANPKKALLVALFVAGVVVGGKVF